MPAISIIMPVFNSEKYLSDAIKSVLTQSYQDLELILINDGSKDDSLKICHNYAAIDSRVIVISQTNCGISKTRNKGIDLAQGKYIAFIDNDDLYAEDLLLDNFNLAEQYDADVVKFGQFRRKIRHDSENTEYEEMPPNVPELILSKDLPLHYPYLRKNGVLENIWNGLYRKSFLLKNNIRFDESVMWGADDQLFNLQIYPQLERLVINRKSYYIWIQRDDHSTSKKFDEKVVEEFIKLSNVEDNLIAHLNTDNSLSDFRTERICNSFMHNYALLNRGNNCSFDSQKKLYNALRKEPLYKQGITLHAVSGMIKKHEKRALVFLLYLLNLDTLFLKQVLFILNRVGYY